MTTSHRDEPPPAELEDMSQPQLARLAAELDDVDVVKNTPKFPVPGTRAEKRASRAVALWFTISALSALAFLGCFLFWPFEYVAPGQPGYVMYAMYTPLIGGFFGLAVLTLGIAVVSYVKKFFPDEVSVQQRHDGPSNEMARKTVVAQVIAAGEDTGIARRSLIKRSAGAAVGLLGLGLGVGAIAPFVKNPWKGGDKAALWTTGWAPNYPGEVVYLRTDTGISDEIRLVRPEDQGAGSMQTVFPFRESERGNPEALRAALLRSDNPVMLIRLRPGTPVVQREGQADYHYGDFYAYSKVCTHLGCPASLYEQQTQRILCPCHQSQFLATEYAKPVFGPATRPLPELPIAIHSDGYLVARGDFREAIGPAFWERSRV